MTLPKYSIAMDLLVSSGSFSYETYLRQIVSLFHRMMAVLEMQLPSALQGTFVSAGSPFDAMAAVGRVISTAKPSVRIVDPYMNGKALTDFAVLADEALRVELMSDAATVKDSLEPAVRRWTQQYANTRQLEVRLASPRSLHDRFILVDGVAVWILSQSLNAFAERAPATLTKMDGDAVHLKVSAYQAIWESAELLAS